MRALNEPDELQHYYRDEAVVDDYLRRRTAQPLNGLLHRAQVRFLNQVVQARRPARVLEIAPGPARLTAELDFRGHGLAVDSSPAMLARARARLRAHGRDWCLLCANAFALPVAGHSVDLAFTLRFIRHFQVADRQRLYAQIRRVLVPGGAFVLDALNRAVSLPHRLQKGLDRYPIFDVLYDPAELVGELEAAGFRVLHLEGMIKHFAVQRRLNRLRRVGLAGLARVLVAAVERVPSTAPSTWMVLCEARE